MRGTLIGLLLLASCAGQDPRENAVLFENAGERAKRNVSTLYYLENANVVFSVVVPNAGSAEACGEWSQAAYDRMRRRGIGVSRCFDQDSVVEAAERDAIEAYFAALPAGASERTLSADPKPRQGADAKVTAGPPCVFTSDTDGRPGLAVPARIRILHVSRSGETKTLRVGMALSKDLPAGAATGDERLDALNRMFLRIASPKLDFSNLRLMNIRSADQLNQ